MANFWQKNFENGNVFGNIIFHYKMAIFWQYILIL